MARRHSGLGVLVAGALLAVPAAAAEGDANEAKGDDASGSGSSEEGPRRDPEGVKGISPFWEALKKGDDKYITRDFGEAAAAYKEALSHEPQNPLGHYRLGQAQVAQGDLKEGQASYETAKRFAANQKDVKAKAMFVLADVHERRRALKQAEGGWSAYESFARAESAVKTYPETPPERKKRIEEWQKLKEQYAAVKQRIKKNLEDADKKAKESAQDG